MPATKTALRASCADCGWVGEPRSFPSDVLLDMRSHLRRRQGSGGRRNFRAPRCEAILRDEQRNAARAVRAKAHGLESEFPSIKWGVDDWCEVFHRFPHVYEAILDGIAGATASWLAGTNHTRLTQTERRAMSNVDRKLGIRDY